MVEAGVKKAAPKSRASSTTAATETARPPETDPHIGTDEAGKGDFFGPMVTAGVYVDARTAQILRTLGVRDSKTVSDRELRGLASIFVRSSPKGSARCSCWRRSAITSSTRRCAAREGT